MTVLAVNLTTSGTKIQKRLGTPVTGFCLIKLFEMGKSTSNPTLSGGKIDLCSRFFR